MVDSVINPQQPVGFLGLLKEIVVHPSITATIPSEMKPKKRRPYTAEDTIAAEDEVALLARTMKSSGLRASKSDKLSAPLIATDESTPPMGITSRISLKAIFSGAVLATYNPHGYDVSTNTVVSTEGADIPNSAGVPTHTYVHTYDGKLNVGHTFLTFLGLQTRFKTFDPTDKTTETKVWTPKMGGWQLLKNYFGGWYPLFDKNWRWIGGERGVWQLIALPIKLVMIPLKIVATVLTFALNLVKIFTELLPELILNGSGLAINLLTDTISKNGKSETLSSGAKWGGIFLAVIATALLAIPHYIARVWLVLGKALTSPEQNIRLAYNFFDKRLEIEGKPNLTKVLRKVFGIFSAALAMSLTIAVWAVALPFAIGALVQMVPQFMVAVNWLASSALIAPAMGYVNGALTVISGFLSIFNPAVAVLSAWVGVTVTPTILAVGATLAALAGFITPIVSRIADDLSNWWAKRGKDSGPVHFIASLLTFKSKKADLPEPAPASEAEATRDQIFDLVRSSQFNAAIDVIIASKLEHLYLVRKSDDSGWDRLINRTMMDAILATRPDAKAKDIVDKGLHASEAAKGASDKTSAFGRDVELDPRSTSRRTPAPLATASRGPAPAYSFGGSDDE